jgi:chorismate dehydratase
MQKINVSVVSYANSVPFVYGLLNSDVIAEINMSLDYPSLCADKLVSGTADVGLIPVVEILRLKTYEIVSDLCIGANDYVKSVILASDVPLHKLRRIYLDYHSRTSVVLVKILAKYFWKINPEWIVAEKGFEEKAVSGNTGAVIIGDNTFSVHSEYKYDLAHEWKQFTGLPFVFAAWVANKAMENNFKMRFNKALNFGVQNLEASAKLHQVKIPVSDKEILDYLKNNVSYYFDQPKQKAKEIFLNYAQEFVEHHIQTSSI